MSGVFLLTGGQRLVCEGKRGGRGARRWGGRTAQSRGGVKAFGFCLESSGQPLGGLEQEVDLVCILERPVGYSGRSAQWGGHGSQRQYSQNLPLTMFARSQRPVQKILESQLILGLPKEQKFRGGFDVSALVSFVFHSYF